VPHNLIFVVTTLMLSAPSGLEGAAGGSQAAAAHAKGPVHIPEPIRIEHQAIHGALVQATKAPGRTGEAAKELAAVLHPHFVREEEIALPPLGLLEPLSKGQRPEGMDAVLEMTDALKRELPRMLEEHTRIHAAVEKLRAAAREERVASAEKLADDLALHAQTEEQVLYPAAILVGDLIRARR
jgi:hypothetical protein